MLVLDDNITLCMGCMERKYPESLRCPNCGYTENEPYLPTCLKPHTVLNERYIIGKMLRYNGEGIIYIAYDTVKDEKITIKEFMPDSLCSRTKGSDEISVNKNYVVQYKTFLSEFVELNKALAKLRTLTQICAVYELFAQNNTAYVVGEYIEGITLKEYLQQNAGELTWNDVKQLFPQLFTTLGLVHNAGIIHRGISPQTIYITENGDCKITDFSIIAVRNANNEIAPELFAGYTAPEQYSSSNWHGTWTDVYAIAAVLYRCLTGCMPTESLARAANDTLKEPAAVNRNIPSNVSKAIMKGMRLSTTARSQTITDFLDDLFEQPAYAEENNYYEDEPLRPNSPVKISDEEDVPEETEKKTVMLAVKVGIITLIVLAVIGGVLLLLLIPDRSSNGTKTIKTTTTTSSSTTSSTTSSSSNNSKTESSEANIYTVPSFLGFEYDRISATTFDNITIVPEYEFNDNTKNGIIFEQSIEEGTTFTGQTSITVKVSKGAKIVTIPEYQGKTGKDYYDSLNSLGLKVELINDYSDTKTTFGNVGCVLGSDKSTKLAVGDKIDKSKEETIYIVVASYSTTTPTTPTTTSSSSANTSQ